ASSRRTAPQSPALRAPPAAVRRHHGREGAGMAPCGRTRRRRRRETVQNDQGTVKPLSGLSSARRAGATAVLGCGWRRLPAARAEGGPGELAVIAVQWLAWAQSGGAHSRREPGCPRRRGECSRRQRRDSSEQLAELEVLDVPCRGGQVGVPEQLGD